MDVPRSSAAEPCWHRSAAAAATWASTCLYCAGLWALLIGSPRRSRTTCAGQAAMVAAATPLAEWAAAGPLGAGPWSYEQATWPGQWRA
jgi:hypothetical protein